jgi:hypothetical protein
MQAYASTFGNGGTASCSVGRYGTPNPQLRRQQRVTRGAAGALCSCERLAAAQTQRRSQAHATKHCKYMIENATSLLGACAPAHLASALPTPHTAAVLHAFGTDKGRDRGIRVRTCSLASSAVAAGPITSGRMLSAWPSFIKVGPKFCTSESAHTARSEDAMSGGT